MYLDQMNLFKQYDFSYDEGIISNTLNSYYYVKFEKLNKGQNINNVDC